MNIFEVKKISYHPPNKGYCVMLSHVEGSKEVPIIIGSNEAQSIALAVESVSMPRPMTHDIIVDIIDSMDISISRVEICDFRKGTFYSKIYLQGTYSDEKYIDCRPSDGIALAVRMRAPIFVEDAVLEKAGIFIDKETGEPIVGSGSQEKESGVGEEELRGMSAFTEFIEGLNLEGLDQGPKGA